MTAVGKMTKTLSVKIQHSGGSLTEYNTAVLSVKETPSQNIQTATVASGETVTDAGPVTWTLDIEYHADWATATSLHRILLDNAGETATFQWQPDPVGAPTYGRSATVILAAPAGDASVGAFQTASVSLPVNGAITSVVV